MRSKTFCALALAAFFFQASLLWADMNEPPPDLPGENSAPATNSGIDSYSPNAASAAPKSESSEMKVLRLDGTVMVKHADKSKPTALQTGSAIEKGDVITAYDQSWVILRDHRGDRIGIDGNTVVTIDECYIEGPERQIRLLLEKGTLFLRTNDADSRQSFFEINTGAVVTSLRDLEAVLSYDPAQSSLLDIKYIHGRINVIDQSHEETFSISTNDYDVSTKTESNVAANENRTPLEHTEHTWQDGKMMETDPIEMDHLDEINYYKFFDGERRVKAKDPNMLLDDSDVRDRRKR